MAENWLISLTSHFWGKTTAVNLFYGHFYYVAPKAVIIFDGFFKQYCIDIYSSLASSKRKFTKITPFFTNQILFIVIPYIGESRKNVYPKE